MKKILIITYYWPPQGGVGVQRWLKLSKYLLKNNYEPIIYTQSNGISPLEDTGLIRTIPNRLKVLRKSIFEPQKIISFLTKKKPSSDILVKTKTSLFSKLLIWLRSNLFIPDSRCLWIGPSISYLNNYLRRNPVDLIISTGPPHSTHLIALDIKKKHNVKWIADFRDPWTAIEYFDKLPLLRFQKSKHKKLEKEVLVTADLVLSVSMSWAKDLKKLGAIKTSVIMNGFDLEDYNYNLKNDRVKKFTIGYFGVYNTLRDHSFFWDIIEKISKTKLDFDNSLNFLFAGEVHDTFFANMKSHNLANKLDYFTYLTHSESIKKMQSCNLLLITQGDTQAVQGRLPAKLFEYIGARKPILAIGKKNSDLEKIISNISYAWFVDFNNSELLYDTIIEIFEISKTKKTFHDDISLYSREEQAKQLIEIIESL